MDAILDAVQGNVVAGPDAVAQPDSAQSDDGATETQLAQEISELWSSHVRLSGDCKTTTKELRLIRARLAERLHAMKSLLARPGRGGEWRGWLRERKIPRSTADRLVARYAKMLCGDDGNVPSGSIPEPATPTAEKLAAAVWSSSLRKVLATGESVVRFIGSIAKIAGVPHEWRQEGLMIFKPAPRAADEVPAPAPATGPAPQPSGGTPPVEGPAVETAAAATEVVQPPAIADTASGGTA